MTTINDVNITKCFLEKHKCIIYILSLLISLDSLKISLSERDLVETSILTSSVVVAGKFNIRINHCLNMMLLVNCTD